MTLTKQNIATMLVCAAMLLTALALFEYRPNVALGSVPIGNEYHATSTTSAVGAFPGDYPISTGSGVLGSVVITGATTGTIELYDATTSNVNARTNNPATTTIILASFPASTAAGTYTFDRAYYNGLYVHITGTTPTSTITFR